MSQSESHPPSRAPAVEPRLSTLVGDRVCIKCSFNLAGQPVVRESVYGMAIVRCPECSTIASLQEYPILGRWAGRMAAAIAAVWLLVLILGLFATAGVMFGMTQSGIQTGSEKLSNAISKKHKEWADTASAQETAGIKQMFGTAQVVTTGPYVWIDSTWWSKQDKGAILAELGGPMRAINWQFANIYTLQAFLAALLGAVWSVFLLNLKRYRLFIFALLPFGLAFGFAFLANTTSSRVGMRWGSGAYAIEEASAMLWPYLVGTGLGVGFVAFCIGSWIGRPLVRRLALLLLPPRMRASLAYLWIAEGKTPPRPPMPK